VSVTASLNGNIQVVDSSSNAVALQKRLASLSVAGKVFSEAQALILGAGATTIALPASPTTFLYIKNLETVKTLAVTWTRAGGSSASVLVLGPGEWISFGSSAGITALSLTPSAASTSIEYILLG